MFSVVILQSPRKIHEMSTASRCSRKIKRKKPIHNTPPNNSVVKKTKKTQDDNQIECLICDNIILEPRENTDGHDTILCEGDCQGWTHRHCAGITRPVFEKLLSESAPYLCPHCTLGKQYNEISALKETIKTLTDKISKLEGNQTSHPKTIHQQPMFPSNQLPGPPNQPKTSLINQQRSSDRKCNVVFYGIAECPPNASKPARSQSDLKKHPLSCTNIESSAKIYTN